MKSGKLPGQDTAGKRRVVLELWRHEELRQLVERLHRKTGMRSTIDLIRMALKNLDANLPEGLSETTR